MNALQKGTYQSESSGFELSAEFSISSEFTAIQKVSETDMHIVYKGVRHGRIWIIKGLAPQYQGMDECRQMLVKEFDIMMHLRHDNIVSAHSIESIPNLGMCIIMEYIEGETLVDWLREKRSLKERFKKALMLTDAFAYINKSGIVHRDIKPENIMISRLGEALKIIDFSHADTDSHTLFKYPAGTEGFISPEQRCSTVPDVRNDVYSFGKVLDMLLPEKRFDYLRSQCRAGIDNRIPEFETLKVKLLKAYRNPVVYSTLMAFIVILVFICFFSFYQSVDKRKAVESPEIPSDTVEISNAGINPMSQIETEPMQTLPVKEKEEAQKSVDPEIVIGAPEGPNTASQSTKTEGSRIINIEKTLITMNKEWEKTAMLYLDTLTDVENIYLDWSTAQLEIIRENFLNTLPPSLTETERNEIKKRLDSNIVYNYKRWQKRRLELKKAL